MNVTGKPKSTKHNFVFGNAEPVADDNIVEVSNIYGSCSVSSDKMRVLQTHVDILIAVCCGLAGHKQLMTYGGQTTCRTGCPQAKAVLQQSVSELYAGTDHQ